MKYLSRKHADLLDELTRIVETTDLVGPVDGSAAEGPKAAERTK